MDSIEKLKDIFRKFPTVGQRTAMRFVYYLMKLPKEKIDELQNAITELKNKVILCQLCFNPFEPFVTQGVPPQGKKQIQRDLFFEVVKAGFSQPRKQLAGNFSKTLKIDKKNVVEWLLKNKINPAQRAETLSIKDWANLCITI